MSRLVCSKVGEKGEARLYMRRGKEALKNYAELLPKATADKQRKNYQVPGIKLWDEFAISDHLINFSASGKNFS